MSDLTVAAQCFAAELEAGIAGERLTRALDAILGDCATGAWDDYTLDPSDASLEVYGVRQGPVPVEALDALGFRKVWLHPLPRSTPYNCGPGRCRCEAITFPDKEPTR